MKVVIHLDGATVRGNERQARLIALGLQRRGHEVVVACRRSGPVRASMDAAGLRTAGVRPRGDLDLVNVLRFAVWLRRLRPDALLLTSWKRAFVAGLAGRLAGVPKIVQRLGGPHPVRPGLRGVKQRLALTRWPHAIVVNSEGLREQVLGELPALDPGRVTVVPSGVAPMRGVESPPRRRVLPDLPPDAVVLLAVGGLEPLKGYDQLIEVLPRLEEGAHLVVAGGGSAARRGALSAAAKRAGVEGRVHLLGQRPAAEIPSLLAASNVLVHPSRVDSLPNAVMEAMAAGVPVVASDVPGMAEALGPRDGDRLAGGGPAGWVVVPGDVEGLAATLSEVVTAVRRGDVVIAERVKEARWRATHVFSVERMLDGYEAALSGGRGAG